MKATAVVLPCKKTGFSAEDYTIFDPTFVSPLLFDIRAFSAAVATSVAFANIFGVSVIQLVALDIRLFTRSLCVLDSCRYGPPL